MLIANSDGSNLSALSILMSGQAFAFAKSAKLTTSRIIGVDELDRWLRGFQENHPNSVLVSIVPVAAADYDEYRAVFYKGGS